MMKYKGYGNQSFEPGITIKEIAKCVGDWNFVNIQQFNAFAGKEGYVIAPHHISGKGVETKKVEEMWRWIQNMDKAAYDTLNWLLRDKMVLLIIPPPPPPPPPGNGQ